MNELCHLYSSIFIIQNPKEGEEVKMATFWIIPPEQSLPSVNLYFCNTRKLVVVEICGNFSYISIKNIFNSDNSYFELFRIFFSINPFPYCDTFIACLSWWIVGGITGYIRKYGKTQAQYWAIFHAILSPKQPRPGRGRINFYLVDTFESKPSS